MIQRVVVISLFLAVIIMGAVIYQDIRTVRDARRETEIAIKALKAVQDKNRALELAYLVANNARIDANKAHFETEKVKHELTKHVFQPLNDSLRELKLSNLYPSYRYSR